MEKDNTKRTERLQIMLTEEETRALDDWRFKLRMPSRSAAVRELLRRGLSAEGFFDQANGSEHSGDFGIFDPRRHDDDDKTAS
ncbi:hypothetical protein FHY55_12195 [Oceanicola sp. D3]|uniref:hypothetical protein n=1 Tax=Oceanicola sp. D3 TaxID=2587163 RepID=UPI001122EE50|nr:hypothetical protein [Oceanicola sp. D3]QDC09956.1 hypothetical protein FHY55_12195 [Oceanicola sp. D3]